MPIEIELKLEVTAQGGEALLASGLLGGDCREKTLHAIYFDTAAHELHRHGHTLRIRDTDGSSVQTIKAGDAAAGLFSRGEWEIPVIDKQPVADSRTPVSELLGPRFGELLPLFEVPVTRQTCTLTRDGAEIEVAIDRGEARAGSRAERFHEVELELISGPSSALFDLARKIDAVAPVRIGVVSKAERGYRLLGALPAAEKAETAPLRPDMDLAGAFAAIAGSCLRQYRLNETILLERRTPEAIHQARIGLRRLRSAMSLFGELLPGAGRDPLNARLRALAQVLGDARDLDVLSEQAGPGLVLDRLREARDEAYAAMDRQLGDRETRLLPLDLAQWIADGDWRSDPATQERRDVPLRSFAATALHRLRHRVDKHGKHLAALDVESRHRLRKDAKKLRYAVEFLAPAFDRSGEKGKRRKFAKALQSLQDALGGLNDHATAEERLAKLGLAGADAEAFLASWKTGHLLKDAAEARDRLLDARPFWH